MDTQTLRRVGVSIDKLLQLQKDDNALTPRELVAVQFARALTRGPASTTDADYATLRTTFVSCEANCLAWTKSNRLRASCPPWWAATRTRRPS